MSEDRQETVKHNLEEFIEGNIAFDGIDVSETGFSEVAQDTITSWLENNSQRSEDIFFRIRHIIKAIKKHEEEQ